MCILWSKSFVFILAKEIKMRLMVYLWHSLAFLRKVIWHEDDVRSRCCSCRGTNCPSYYPFVETMTGSSTASLTSDTASLDRQHQQPRTGPYLEHVGCGVLVSPLWHSDGGWWKEVVKGWCQEESLPMDHRLLHKMDLDLELRTN